jgi:hypothetical protein
MARGGSSFDDIVKAVAEQLVKNRPNVVSAAKRVEGAPSYVTKAVRDAVKKAMGFGPDDVAKVTSRTRRATSPKPSKSASKPMTKEQRRVANQKADAERRAMGADKRAADKAAQQKANREKYLNKEKSKVETRMTPQMMRQQGYPLISNALTKKMNSVDFKTRLLQNQGGMLDKQVNIEAYKLVKLYQKDGRQLTPKQVSQLRKNVESEIKSFAERNLDKLSRGVNTRLKNLGKMTPEELDTEAGRMAFRAKKAKVRKGAEPKDSRRDYQIRQDKERNMRLEALERKRADAARNRGTGTSTGPKVKGPESAKAREKRLSALASERKLVAAQDANAAKRPKVKPLFPSSKKYTAAELKDVKLTTSADVAAARAVLGKGGEGYNVKPSVPLRSGRRQETAEELNARLAAFRAKQSKGSKAPKRK